ncbi:hypothetical protein Pcinc_025515 [Petrolisthes cinctipes]|uniref:Protein singed wings 2 n=1 Tax=Petrolisthes cinctipes TaxID=88211 RepID=A0AAE1F7S8_PETCI|nr:hypothetical protein Pcinc_025515 [Petrolisthes cinctipes]
MGVGFWQYWQLGLREEERRVVRYVRLLEEMWLTTMLWLAAVACLVTAVSTNLVNDKYFVHAEVEVQAWTPKEPINCSILTKSHQKNEVEVVCVGLSTLAEVEERVAAEVRSSVTALTIDKSTLTQINTDDLHTFPALTSLSFNNSLLSGWMLPIGGQAPHVTTLVLYRCYDSYSKMVDSTHPGLALTTNILNTLPELEVLHLVECYLYNLHLLSPPSSLHNITIQGGGAECRDESLWLMKEERVKITKNTTCFIVNYKLGDLETRLSFFDKSFVSAMGYWQAMVRDCPKLCVCTMTGMRNIRSPIINVICSNVGLTQIPEVIPELSTTIFLDNNSITNFSRVFTNPLYHHLDVIHLQHNLITHMDGRLFYLFARDRPLDLGIDLSHNRLTRFPVDDVQPLYDEALENGIYHLPVFGLGYNPWNCDDCSFLPGFQKIVYHQYYENQYRYRDIRCQEGPKEETSRQQVVKLDVVGLCQPDPPVLKTMDVLIISLSLLLVLFILNFLHNYFQYRRHGKLPWMITKIPFC